MKKILTSLAFLISVGAAGAADLVELKPSQQLWNQGLAAYQRGAFDEAIKIFSARTRVGPPDANVYYYLGNCYLSTKKHEDAAKMFSACIRMSPASQAGQYSLQALEKLSTMPKTVEAPKPTEGIPDAAAVEASKDSLLTERALDKSYNEAVKRIQNERVALKRRIDQVYERLQDELMSVNRRSTPNFAAELTRMKAQAEIEVEQMQMKQLRWESRLLAPDKVDVRAVPELPKKIDDSQNALGTLFEYFKEDKPFDPLGTDITPELTAKFMTIKDAFGDLHTYQPQARSLAKQMFMQMKSGIQTKQDSFDMQVHELKERMLRDVYTIQCNSGNQNTYKNLNPMSYLTSTKIPRLDKDNLSPMEIELSQAADRAKRRIKELQESYNRDVDSIISGTKERLASLVGQSITMGSQLKNPKGTVQLVPTGTSLHTRNYVNFGDHADPPKKK
jgi:tetratricopeptide (TPR) repeat protein